MWLMAFCSSSGHYMPKENVTLMLGKKCLANNRILGKNVLLQRNWSDGNLHSEIKLLEGSDCRIRGSESTGDGWCSQKEHF